jgi:glycerate 2-kinase
MRVVVVVGRFDATLGGAEAAQAITTGWRTAAPDDELTVLPSADDRLGTALDSAGLAITGAAEFDWQSLRSSLVTAVAGAAVERGVPCVVIAGRVSVGRREASAIGVDAAYAVADGSAAGVDPGTAAVDAAALSVLAERVARRWSR